MNLAFVRRAAYGATLAIAGLVASACTDETANYLEPTNVRAYNFLLLREGTNLPRGTVATTRQFTSSGTIAATVELRALEQLATGYFYQLWVADETAGKLSNFRPLESSQLFIFHTDTTISAEGDFVPNVDTLYNVAGPGQYQFNYPATAIGPGVLVRLIAAPLAVPAGTTRLSVLVTVDNNQAAPTPPDSQGGGAKLWARNIVPAAPAAPVAPATNTTTTASVAFSFGNLNTLTTAATRPDSATYVYGASGRGQGAVLNDDIMEVYDTLLARPPKGYFYQVHLASRDTNQSFNWRDTISLSPLTAPNFTTSLFEADMQAVDPVVQTAPLQLIYAAGTRLDADTVAGLLTTGNRFRGQSNFFITLENKNGIEAMSPNIILNGVLPEPIRFRE
jgi:hypothetical protein